MKLHLLIRVIKSMVSEFYFCHNDFKSFLLQMHENTSAAGVEGYRKSLYFIFMFSKSSAAHLLYGEKC